MEIKSNGQSARLLVLLVSYISSLAHLVQYHIATFAATLRITHRIEQRRILAESYQCCCLLKRKVLGVLIEIGGGCGLYTYCIMQKVEIVEIQSYYLLLGIVALKLYGYHPLYRLLQQAFERTAGSIRIQLLGKLLSNCTATTGTGLS